MQIDRTAPALAALVFVVGCADKIGREELLARIESGAPPVIVDVRSRGEYEESHVPGAVHIPFHAIVGGAETLPEPTSPEEPVVLYCEHGPRAGLARAQLWFVDDRPVRFMRGHMTAWKEDGLPVERVASPEGAEGGESETP